MIDICLLLLYIYLCRQIYIYIYNFPSSITKKVNFTVAARIILMKHNKKVNFIVAAKTVLERKKSVKTSTSVLQTCIIHMC